MCLREKIYGQDSGKLRTRFYYFGKRENDFTILGLFNHFCHQTDMLKAEEFLGRLETLYKESPGNSEVAEAYAKGLVNHIGHQTDMQKEEELLNRLEALYKENPGNSEVAETYAKGLFNHFNNQTDMSK